MMCPGTRAFLDRLSTRSEGGLVTRRKQRLIGKGSRRRGIGFRLQRPGRVPRTAAEFFSMSADNQHRYTKALEALNEMRTKGSSLRRAAESVSLRPVDVLQLARHALRKRRGRYVPTTRDSLLRVLNVVGERGIREVPFRDSRAASLVSGHPPALGEYWATGNAKAVLAFRRLRIVDARGRRVRLLTNLAAIDRLGHAGLRFESLYAMRTS